MDAKLGACISLQDKAIPALSKITGAFSRTRAAKLEAEAKIAAQAMVEKLEDGVKKEAEEQESGPDYYDDLVSPIDIETCAYLLPTLKARLSWFYTQPPHHK